MPGGLELYPEDEELLFRLGIVLHQLQRNTEAIDVYRRVLTEREPRHFTSVDPGILGHKARHNLALVYLELGRVEEADLQFRHEFSPNGPCTVRPGLAWPNALLRQEKPMSLDIALSRLQTLGPLRTNGNCCKRSGRWPVRSTSASANCCQPWKRTGKMRPGWPGSDCRLLYESGPLDAAERLRGAAARAKLSDDLAQLGGRLFG